MKRRSQACKIIFDCFRDVPELINSVEQTLGRFSRSEDPEIYCCATRLYSAIVDSLPPLIDHLLRGSGQSSMYMDLPVGFKKNSVFPVPNIN